jgi:hypothetical protein
MKTAKPKFKQSWISKYVLSLVITLGFVGGSFAVQFDAPYNKHSKKHTAAWAEEDKDCLTKGPIDARSTLQTFKITIEIR